MSALRRFSALGSFKHEMFSINFMFLEQKGRELHFCLICCSTQDGKNVSEKIAENGDHEGDNTVISVNPGYSVFFETLISSPFLKSSFCAYLGKDFNEIF